MSRKTGEPRNERGEQILHDELERRLVFLEENDDSVFGEFSTLDWILCTLLFFLFLTASLPACIVPGIVYTIWLTLRPLPRVALPARGQSLAQPNV